MFPRPKYDGTPMRWDCYSLRSALKRESLGGHYIWGKEQQIEIPCPPILDEGRHALLVKELRKTGRGKYRARRVYPLSGRLMAPCGSAYSGVTWGEGTPRYYRCRGKGCGCRSLNAAWVEEQVWKEFYGLISAEQAILALIPRFDRDDAEAAAREVARLDRQIASKEEARGVRAAEALEAGLDPALIKQAVERIDRDLELLRQRRQEMQDWHLNGSESNARRDRLQFLVSTSLHLGWPSVELQEEVFRALAVTVQVMESGKSPKLKIEGNVTNEVVSILARHAEQSPRLTYTSNVTSEACAGS